MQLTMSMFAKKEHYFEARVKQLEAALASEQQDYQDAEAMLHAERDNSQALRDKVAQQAAVIESAS